MIKVLIADDHALFRAGVKQLLAGTSDISVEAEASNGKEVIVLLDRHDFDVILLDISMPGAGGVEVIKRIKSTNPDQVILVVTMHPVEQYGIRVLRSGASGYFNKEGDVEDLIKAIRKVAGGGWYVDGQLGEQFVTRLKGVFRKPRHENLSDREFQVLNMIAAGKTTKNIAVELSLSIKTISTYRARIFEKMNMKTDVELANYANQHGLLG